MTQKTEMMNEKNKCLIFALHLKIVFKPSLNFNSNSSVGTLTSVTL